MIQILQGDCREVLRTLAPNSVHCIVTSPPYFGLRAYLPGGHPDKHREIGIEATPAAYLDRLMEVFVELWRVLRDDGTCWMVIGDSYASAGGAGWQGKNGARATRRFTAPNLKAHAATLGVKPKDLIGIPWLCALALRDAGWYLRSSVIWNKPSVLPESVRDRPTKSHEYVFLFAKGQRYYYDAAAIAEPAVSLDPKHSSYRPNSARIAAEGRKEFHAKHTMSARQYSSRGRNKRSVWTVAPQPFNGGEHFATFPALLIEPCILAGTSAHGCCSKCGAPYRRKTSRRQTNPEIDSDSWSPGCTCEDGAVEPCTVLDPFGGSGTTALVADRLQRNSILIELNERYVELARKRLRGEAPLITELATRNTKSATRNPRE